MKIEITSEMMQAARDYVPLEEKEAWVSESAPNCFDRIAISVDDESMPEMYMVNTGKKSRYLMGALAKLYFGAEDIGADADNEWLMSVEKYDEWAGGHVFNQIERWKRDADFKFKAYDIMYDYKDLEKRMSTQISSLLAVQNDAVIRQARQSADMMRELPALLTELKAYEDMKGKGEEDGSSDGPV